MLRRRLFLTPNAVRCCFQEQQIRNTWVLQHVHPPPKTAPGEHQRPPDDLQSLMKYEVVRNERVAIKALPLDVILLQDIEGVGNQFDVVKVDRKLARYDLLITGKAVYASPFNMKKYDELRQSMADELAKRQRVDYQVLLMTRALRKLVVPICMSLENKWTIAKTNVRAALRHAGVEAPEDAIYLPPDAISGPNLAIEAKLIRFYVVLSDQYVVPMIGRITHVSADSSSELLFPESPKEPSSAELAKWGLQPEATHFHKAAEFTPGSVDVYAFMQSLANKNTS